MAHVRRLRFENHRLCEKRADFTRTDKKQLESARYFTWDMDENEFNGAECYDIADEATGKVVYQLWFYVDGGNLFRAGTPEMVADINNYGGAFVPVEPNRALREEMADAYERVKDTLKPKGLVCFPKDARETKPAPPKPGRPESIEAQLAEWRRAAKAGSPPKADEYFYAVLWDALGAPHWKRGDIRLFRPYPVWRWFELGPAAREALELLVDMGEGADGFACLGVPLDEGELARFVGRAPPAGPLDETVDIGGNPHPVWALVSDVVYKRRPMGEVAGHMKRGLSAEKLASVWRALSDMPPRGTQYNLKHYFPATEKEYQQGGPYHTPRYFEDLFAELLAAIAPQSTDADAHSVSLLSRFRRKTWESYTQLTSERDDALAAIAAFRHLHASAKTRGEVLSPEYDALFETVMRATMAPVELAYPILDELPLERSSKIAGGHLHMLARYPTRDGLERAIRRLENPDWWLESPFYDKAFTSLVLKVGDEARPMLEAAIARTFPKSNKYMRKLMVARMKKALAELKRRSSKKKVSV